jgi:hypothetical protein
VRTLAGVAWLAPVGGLCMLGWLGWALGARLDFWPARSFVLLFDAAGLLAMISSVSARLAHRRAPRLVRMMRWPRRALWAGVLVGSFWSMWPPSRAVVAYAIRQVSVLRFR